MYTTEQFDKDVAGLRALIKMCDDLEKENNKKADALIKQINGENAFTGGQTNEISFREYTIPQQKIYC